MKPLSSLLFADLPAIRQPDLFCFVQGSSEGFTPLNAFDNALLDAGIGDLNLIRMSSIIPPGAVPVDRKRLHFLAGGFLPIAYAHIDSVKPGQFISAAVAVGIPEDQSQAGVIMEHSERGRLAQTEALARDMIRNAFKSRNRELKEIRSTGIEHRVERCGAAFAGVVIWWSGGSREQD
jgi:arginine decarboxylase